MGTTIYRPLEASKSEIRLIEILSDGEDGGLVKCKLSTVSLDDDPSFTALSYVWGDADDAVNIVLNGDTVPATRNLESALHYVRRQWTSANRDCDPSGFRLWADAICINQNNKEERASQVQLMRQVYTSAVSVISWLGPTDWSPAFSTIDTIAIEMKACDNERILLELKWLEKYPELRERTDKTGLENDCLFFKEVSKLLKNPYWQRVWVFQELVLARRLLFIGTGERCLFWPALEIVWQGLEILRNSVESTLTRKPKFLLTEVWNEMTLPLITWSHIGVIALVRSDREHRKTYGLLRKWDMWMLSTHGGNLAASDPKDHIYGLLGITELDITPDYTPQKSVGDLYTEYVVAWLEVMRQADIRLSGIEQVYPLYFLNKAGVGLFGHTAGFPTWAPNFFENSKKWIPTTPSHRFGLASRGLFKGCEEAYPYICSETKSLFVRGVKLEHITAIANSPGKESITNGEMLHFIREFISRHPLYISGIPSLQALFRLVNRDVTSSINHAMIGHFLAFMEVICSLDAEDDNFLDGAIRKFLDLEPGNFDEQIITKLFPGVDPKDYGFQENLEYYLNDYNDLPLKEFKYKVCLNLSTVGNWRFIETLSGYLGLAPAGTRPGDVLCVVEHLDVPIVLRKPEEGDYYLFVGTASVVGLMDGEAVSFLESGRSQPELFEVR